MKPKHITYPPLFLPDIPLNLLIICRSVTVIDNYLYQQRLYGNISQAKVQKFFHPEDLEAWKDRAKDCHVIAIEQHGDPIYFREQVGRIKLFFSFMDIITPLN